MADGEEVDPRQLIAGALNRLDDLTRSRVAGWTKIDEPAIANWLLPITRGIRLPRRGARFKGDNIARALGEPRLRTLSQAMSQWTEQPDIQILEPLATIFNTVEEVAWSDAEMHQMFSDAEGTNWLLAAKQLGMESVRRVYEVNEQLRRQPPGERELVLVMQGVLELEARAASSRTRSASQIVPLHRALATAVETARVVRRHAEPIRDDNVYNYLVTGARVAEFNAFPADNVPSRAEAAVNAADAFQQLELGAYIGGVEGSHAREMGIDSVSVGRLAQDILKELEVVAFQVPDSMLNLALFASPLVPRAPERAGRVLNVATQYPRLAARLALYTLSATAGQTGGVTVREEEEPAQSFSDAEAAIGEVEDPGFEVLWPGNQPILQELAHRAAADSPVDPSDRAAREAVANALATLVSTAPRWADAEGAPGRIERMAEDLFGNPVLRQVAANVVIARDMQVGEVDRAIDLLSAFVEQTRTAADSHAELDSEVLQQIFTALVEDRRRGSQLEHFVHLLTGTPGAYVSGPELRRDATALLMRRMLETDRGTTTRTEVERLAGQMSHDPDARVRALHVVAEWINGGLAQDLLVADRDARRYLITAGSTDAPAADAVTRWLRTAGVSIAQRTGDIERLNYLEPELRSRALTAELIRARVFGDQQTVSNGEQELVDAFAEADPGAFDDAGIRDLRNDYVAQHPHLVDLIADTRRRVAEELAATEGPARAAEYSANTQVIMAGIGPVGDRLQFPGAGDQAVGL